MSITNTFTIFKDLNEKISTYRESNFDIIKEILAGGIPALQVARITQEINAEPDKTKQTELKKTLPFLTVSSCYHTDAINKDIFPTLKDNSGKELLDDKGNRLKGQIQLQHSGVICVDFDHLTKAEMTRVTEFLQSYEATILLHVSPRGEGLKCYFQVQGIQTYNHKDMYTVVLLHLYDKLGVLADTSCTNVNRGTFLPYQPDYFFNENSKAIDGMELLKQYPNAPNKLKELNNIIKRGEVFTEDLKTWDLNKKKTTKKLTASKTSKADTKNIITLLSEQDKFNKYVEHILAKNGLPSEGNDRHGFYLKLVNLKKEGIQPDNILQMAIDWTANNKQLLNPYNGSEIREYLGRCLRDENGYEIPQHIFYPTQSKKTEKERITIKDVRNVMQDYYDFFYDKTSDRYYYSNSGNTNPFEFTMFTSQDKIFNSWLELLEDHHVFIQKPYLESAIMNNKTYTEISYIGIQLDYLHKQYNGKDYITQLIKSVSTDNDDLFKTTFIKWCVAIVSQCLSTEQFARNDNALVFISKQNMGKTGFFERLLWNFDLYASKPNFNFDSTKDALMLNEKVLILLDEMSSYNKGDVKQMKHFFSQSKITGDRKYQQTADYKRYASFAGCSNNIDILKDDTGERRLLVFDLLRYDKDDFNKVDKNQFWGQIVDLYKSDFDYKFTDKEVSYNMKRNAEKYSIHKPEDTFIDTYLTISYCVEDFMSNTELEKLINEYTKEENVKSFISPSVIKAKMETLGVNTQRVKKVGGKTVRGLEGVRAWKRSVNPNNYSDHVTEKPKPVTEFDFNTEDREYNRVTSGVGGLDF